MYEIRRALTVTVVAAIAATATVLGTTAQAHDGIEDGTPPGHQWVLDAKDTPHRDASAAIAQARSASRERARSLAGAVVRTPDGPGVDTEAELRAAWTDPRETKIELTGDIFLRNCYLGDPIRESPYPMLLDGQGHFIRQTCFEKRLLRQDGTGYLQVQNVHLSRGGSDGPGAAITSRGEIMIIGCTITQNLAEEPGGGVFSMRRVTVRDSVITGNLANDDGGGVYARRGGVQIYDSVLSNNLVDGSGGAVGSTGDILIVRTRIDGNTTDGDGGALYTDEAGDVTVVDSTIDGSDADGPGGAIFTLDGDVAILNSTLVGNRADDRGGAISGEADVLVVNSTIARNLAVAHVGGGVWARGNLLVVNSTVTDNYAEGQGGGLLAAAGLALIGSTVSGNIAPVGANLGAGGRFTSVGSVIGPAFADAGTGDTRPTRQSCRVYATASGGYNLVTDTSCELADATDDRDHADPLLAALEEDPTGRVMYPRVGSPVLARVPRPRCVPTVSFHLPAAQLLGPDEDTYVDWDSLLGHDQVGTARASDVLCDIGAVQVGVGR